MFLIVIVDTEKHTVNNGKAKIISYWFNLNT